MEDWKRVGRITKKGDRYVVFCAATGKGLTTPTGVSRQSAVSELRQLGWSNQPDGRWRCPEVLENVLK